MAFPSNCLPRVITVDDSCGCTLTRANIVGMTPQAFENLGNTEIEMQRVIGRSAEARVSGVMENFLQDLFLSRLKNVKDRLMQGKVDNASVILPYIYRRQKRNINANNWNITAGVVDPNAGVGNIPASAWDITVQISASPWATSLPNLEKYFLPGKYITVLNKDAATGVGHTLQFKVIAAVNADAGGVYKAKVTVQPNVTDAGWAGWSGSQKAVYQPINGMVINMSNSVSDYQSWCYNQPAQNPWKLLTSWLQTTRETFCYNDEWLRALNAELTSTYFKQFKHLPLAEMKRIEHVATMKEWYNSIFYGQQINEHQTVETYTSLPQVVDPLNTDCVLEYQANALGFRQQLSDCSRVTDLQGGRLSLDTILSMGYDVKRAREATGGSVDTIDVMTDRFTSGRILQVMSKLYSDKYGITSTRYYEPNVPLKFENQIMLQYNTYQIPDDMGGFNLAVFTHPYFDDHLLAMDAANKTRGRGLWMLDWSDLSIGIAATAAATRQTNVADNLYNCVIRPNVNHYQLESTLWTAELDDLARHNLIENFSDACPLLTVDTDCSPYNP